MATERELDSADVESADEIFLTSSTRDVHPVVKLNERQWDEPGSVTREISTQFVRRIVQDIDP
jgi:branched-chain amino acid aminotransferase